MARTKYRPDILVIDDSAVIGKMISSILEAEGYRTRTALSGEDGLKAMMRVLPDAILCDIVMPGMDGYEFCRQVKRRRGTRNIPVILLTSRSDPRDKVKGLDLGAADYVTKPFDAGELRARVAAHLRIVMLQNELRTRNKLLSSTRKQLEEKVEALSEAYNHLSDLQAKRQKALELAYKVQLGLLPSCDPVIDGFAFGSRFMPADNIAGDFYDYIPLDEGRWGIAIGDVAGKGLPASLLMVLTKTLLRTEAQRHLPPSKVLENVNRQIISNYGSTEAVTLFYGILDPATNSFTYSNGGHEFPIVCHTLRGQCSELGAGGTFLGIFPDAKFNEARVHLSDQDLLLLYTDGLYHLSIAGKPITTEKTLRDLLLAEGAAGAKMLLTSLPPRSPGADDVTLISMHCGRTIEGEEIGAIRIFNEPNNLKDVRDFTGLVGAQVGLTQGECYDLVYAVDEAATNAVAYAYERPNSGIVEVNFRRGRGEGHLALEVIDHGFGAPPDAMARERQSLASNLLQPGGRGFVLMESLMDSCDIIPTPGGGTTVRMTKRLST